MYTNPIRSSASINCPYSPIIYLEGHFDLLHTGHLEVFERVLEKEREILLKKLEEDGVLVKGQEISANDDPRPKDLGARYTRGKDRLIRTHGQRPAYDPRVIIGVTPTLSNSRNSPCIQTLHERALSVLSLRCVDEVIIGSEFLSKRQTANWRNFKNALGIERVYGIMGHEDFLDVDERLCFEINAGNSDSLSADSYPPGFFQRLDCSFKPDPSAEPSEPQQEGQMTREQFLRRIQKNMGSFEERQQGKKEPGVTEKSSEPSIDKGVQTTPKSLGRA